MGGTIFVRKEVGHRNISWTTHSLYVGRSTNWPSKPLQFMGVAVILRSGLEKHCYVGLYLAFLPYHMLVNPSPHCANSHPRPHLPSTNVCRLYNFAVQKHACRDSTSRW